MTITHPPRPSEEHAAPWRRRHPVRALVVALTGLALTGLAIGCTPGPPTCDGRPATIVGTAGPDTLNGTAGVDVIAGSRGDDTINGLGGGDVLCGGPGIDVLNGGADDDQLEGGPEANTVDGGTGNDTVTYRQHPYGVEVYLDVGMSANGERLPGIENIVGSRYDDRLVGNDLANNLFAQGGSDTMIGNGGEDRLVDNSSTLADENTFDGGTGDDHLVGGGGTDIAHFVGASSVYADLRAGSASTSGRGTDELVAIDGVVGTVGDDTLLGDGRNNVLEGGFSDDYIVGFGGDDELDGGPNTDMVSYAGLTTPVIVNLSFEYASGDGADRLIGIESITGGRGDDRLAGDAGPNAIDGYLGTDTCNGGGGADTFLRCP